MTPLQRTGRTGGGLVFALSMAMTAVVMASHAGAQNSGTPQSAAEPPPAPVLVGPVRSAYNPTKDSTQVWTPPSSVGSGIEIYGSFWFPGKAMKEAPRTLNLVFRETSAGGKWEKAGARTLILWIDDTTAVTVPSTLYRQRVDYGTGGVSVKATEWVWTPVPAEQFSRIAAARSLRGTLGHTNFIVTEEQLARFRALAARAASSPPASPSGSGP